MKGALVLMLCRLVLGAAVKIYSADENALLAFKAGLTSTGQYLDSWKEEADCTSWDTVTCNDAGRVTRLDAPKLGFQGTISPRLGKLTNLEYLYLQDNELSGSIPLELGNLKNLKELILSGNQLGGSIPSELGNLKNLTYLTLAGNKLVGGIPAKLGKVSKLQYLYLWNNQLGGSIPPDLGNLKSLKGLSLINNLLTGNIPSSFGKLTQLSILYLSDNYLSGQVTFCLPRDRNYTQFITDTNCLDWSNTPSCNDDLKSRAQRPSGQCGPRGVKIAKEDQNVLLAFKAGLTSTGGYLDSWKEGADCSSWNTITCNDAGRVTKLDAPKLGLQGTISPRLGKLTNLEYLYLNDNQLRGSIPLELGNLKNLKEFDVSSNVLTGNFLVSFGSQSLSSVILNDNFLSGPAIITNSGANFCPKLGRKIGLENNCFNYTKVPPCFSVTTQKKNVACNAFCRAQQFQGSCGGHGDCIEASNGDLTCQCGEGYNNKDDHFKCVFSVSSTGLAGFPAVQNPKFLNRHFRYASTGFLQTRLERATWLVALSWSWKDEFANWPVETQGLCGACWAFAPVAALEAAYAITHALSTPPRLSAQQLIDCQGSNTCAGGWPGDALEYAAQQSLQMAQDYPYEGRNKSRTCPSTATAREFRISMYEEVEFFGWVGLLLAVQQQPVIVNVEASTSAFINYKGGIFSSNDCYLNGVDHTVLLVGYDLSTSPQHWVIRNSWGTSWGEGGYMRLAIAGGVGTCGINALPGIYPVFKKASDPCNKASRVINKAGPGTINPCGDGTCTPKGSLYTCLCSAPFVMATNIDKSQTCIPAAPCAYFSSNPCGVGTCVDTPRSGEYSCLCPIGYAQGSFASDGKPTCVLGSTVPGLQFYTVPTGLTLPCNTLIGSYNIPSDNFFRQNKGLKCARPLPPGTLVNVTTSIAASGCSLPYTISAKDTCLRVANLFGIKSLGMLNPGLNCNSLFSGQQVCIEKGPPLPPPLCTTPYTLAPNESCTSVIRKAFSGKAKLFYAVNPGIYCDRIFSGGASAQQVPLIEVCLGSTSFGAINKACKGAKKEAKVKAGQRCLQIYKKYFNGKRTEFAKYNKNFQCRDAALRVGMNICVPK